MKTLYFNPKLLIDARRYSKLVRLAVSKHCDEPSQLMEIIIRTPFLIGYMLQPMFDTTENHYTFFELKSPTAKSLNLALVEDFLLRGPHGLTDLDHYLDSFG